MSTFTMFSFYADVYTFFHLHFLIIRDKIFFDHINNIQMKNVKVKVSSSDAKLRF